MDVREDDLGFDYEMEINEESCKIAKDHDENSIVVRWFPGYLSFSSSFSTVRRIFITTVD